MRRNRVALVVALACPVGLAVCAQTTDTRIKGLGIATLTGGQPTPQPRQISTAMQRTPF